MYGGILYFGYHTFVAKIRPNRPVQSSLLNGTFHIGKASFLLTFKIDSRADFVTWQKPPSIRHNYTDAF
jgi:hypothetical protein